VEVVRGELVDVERRRKDLGPHEARRLTRLLGAEREPEATVRPAGLDLLGIERDPGRNDLDGAASVGI
jgi:hypothetical protein